MRTFGGFISNDEFFYGEVRGDSVHILKKPYWLGLEFDGAVLPLRDLQIDLPVAPGKIIAVGLNYADHIAEMKRTPLGTPLIWFKAPTSLLPHEGTIEIAFPEHQTHFELELGVVIGTAREERQRGPCTRARVRIYDRRRYQRSRFADFRETIWASQILRHLHAGGTVCLHGRGRHGSADHAPAKRRGPAASAHEPDDLFDRGDCFLRQPEPDPAARGPHPHRNALGRRSDPRGRSARRDNRRLGALAELRSAVARK